MIGKTGGTGFQPVRVALASSRCGGGGHMPSKPAFRDWCTGEDAGATLDRGLR